MPRAATAVILCGRSCDRARGSARPAAWCWPRSPGRWHARWLGAGRKPSAGCQGFLWVRRAQRPLWLERLRPAIARSDQFFLKLQPFVGRHGRLLALRRQILDGRITACSRTCRGTQRARPSVMSQWMSRSHQAKGNTAATLRQRALSFLVTFVNAFNTVRHGGPRRLRQKLSASSHEQRILRSNLPPASFCENFGSIFQLF